MNAATATLRRPPARPRPRFYLAAAAVTVAVALVGFARTFFLPLAHGAFVRPWIFFVHGGLFFAWVFLFAAQAVLAHRRILEAHRTLGWAMVLAAPCMMVSTVLVGVAAMHRDVAAGLGPVAVSSLVGTCTAMVVFAIFLALAVAYRRRGDVHKRLMLLATIAILWPAWFRFRHYFPSVPHPEYVFAIGCANLMLPVAMLYDWRTLGRVHPVYLWGGSALVAEQLFEAIAFDSPPWRALAGWLESVLA